MTDTVNILKVEIDDSEFEQFKQNFAKFRAEADEMPDAWAATDAQVAKIRANFEKMHAALGDQSAAAGDVTDKSKKNNDFTLNWVKTWSTLYRNSRNFKDGVAAATLSLARWRGLTAAFSGLVGAGGLFGLNTLAASAARRRSEALGVGATYGERAAFGVDFAKIGNTDAILSGVNAAITDVNRQQPLLSLGVNSRGKNATQVFAELLPLVKKLVDRTDPSQLGNVAQSYGLGQLGLDTTTLMTIRGMKTSEIDEMSKAYGRDSKSMDVPDTIARRWTEFTTAIGKAETQIGTTLARNLVNITPGLTDLSKNVVTLFDDITKDSHLTAALKTVGDTLTAWADSVGSDEVQKKIERFVKKFDATKQDFEKLNSWFDSHKAIVASIAGAIVGARFGGWRGAVAGAVEAGLAALPEKRKEEILARHTALQEVRAHRLGGFVNKAEQVLGFNKPTGSDAIWARTHHGREALRMNADPSYVPPSKGTAHPAAQNAPSSAPGSAAAYDKDIAGDISGTSTYRRIGEKITPQGFVVHHTGGRGTPQSVEDTLNQRGLGVQYIMDRDGKVYRALPEGNRAAHIVQSEVKGLPLDNSNTFGMEVIAKDDSDVTPAQVAAARKFYKDLKAKYPTIRGAYGHGYLNPGHKQATEGKTISDAIRADEKAGPLPVRTPAQAGTDAARGVPLQGRGFLGKSYTGGGKPSLAGVQPWHMRSAAAKAHHGVDVHDATGGSVHVEVAPR